MTFFGFPQVKWLRLTGEVDKSVRCSCQIFSGFNIPKIIKIGQFLTELFKNKKVDVFGTQDTLLYRCLSAASNVKRTLNATKLGINVYLWCWREWLAGSGRDELTTMRIIIVITVNLYSAFLLKNLQRAEFVSIWKNEVLRSRLKVCRVRLINVLETVRQRVPGRRTGVGKRPFPVRGQSSLPWPAERRRLRPGTLDTPGWQSLQVIRWILVSNPTAELPLYTVDNIPCSPASHENTTLISQQGWKKNLGF